MPGATSRPAIPSLQSVSQEVHAGVSAVELCGQERRSCTPSVLVGLGQRHRGIAPSRSEFSNIMSACSVRNSRPREPWSIPRNQTPKLGGTARYTVSAPKSGHASGQNSCNAITDVSPIRPLSRTSPAGRDPSADPLVQTSVPSPHAQSREGKVPDLLWRQQRVRRRHSGTVLPAGAGWGQQSCCSACISSRASVVWPAAVGWTPSGATQAGF